MLVLYIFILMFTNSINQIKKNIHSTYINRITIITLIISILFTINSLYFQSIGKGISLYSGLFQTTIQSHLVEILLLIVGIFILLGWPVPNSLLTPASGRDRTQPFYQNYSLIAIFSILGGSLLMSSLDLLSMYLSIELQSFALYILATLNKERLSATSAGLKYFLLGSLSSCFILLGSGIIYSYTGLTQFEAINSLMSIPYLSLPVPKASTVGTDLAAGLFPIGRVQGQETSTTVWWWSFGVGAEGIKKAFTIGLILIVVGFLFKISAAPFYQWAPDVYDGTPTIVTVWLTIVVKLTILIFLLGLFDLSDQTSAGGTAYPLHYHPTNEGTLSDWLTSLFPFSQLTSTPLATPYKGYTALDFFGKVKADVQIKNLLFICSLLSLLIGTIAGLSQIKVKRLLAFSSISHVGFLLLALGIFTQNSIDSFIFYLVQYSITSLNIFLIILAFGYLLYLPSLSGTYVAPIIPTAPTDHSAPLENRPLANLSRQELAVASPSGLALSPTLVGLRSLEQDINYLIELKGQLYKNPVLSVSLAICLFSMAGIPPLIGFFSKQFVLFSSIENGNYFLSIIAILVSVISASYYLRVIKLTFFDSPSSLLPIPKGEGLPTLVGKGAYAASFTGKESYQINTPTLASGLQLTERERSLPTNMLGNNLQLKVSNTLPMGEERSPSAYAALEGAAWARGEVRSNPPFFLGQGVASQVHSYIISTLTLMILFFFLDPSIILNGTQLITLTIFNL